MTNSVRPLPPLRGNFVRHRSGCLTHVWAN